MKPKVSIVIPAHNEELYIGTTLRYVLAQDYPNFEVIVVDNVSTDLTAKIASGFPVKVVREENKGLLWARERGRKEATGDIIANIDGDCMPETDWISRGIVYFERPEVAAVTGPYDYHDGDKLFNMTSLFTQQYIYRFFNWLFQSKYLRNGAVLIGGNNMIRAEALRKAGGYNTDLVFYGEDTDTARRVSLFGRIVLDKHLLMKTSARRFKDEGRVRLSVRYIYHFFKHSFSKRHTA